MSDYCFIRRGISATLMREPSFAELSKTIKVPSPSTSNGTVNSKVPRVPVPVGRCVIVYTSWGETLGWQLEIELDACYATTQRHRVPARLGHGGREPELGFFLIGRTTVELGECTAGTTGRRNDLAIHRPCLSSRR